jgi:hypothetical protein
VICFVVGTAHAQCKPGDLLVGEDADSYICRNVSEYRGSSAEQAGMSFCSARRFLVADQNAIRQLGFANDTERFEMFAGVAREQKAELKHKVFDALLDQGLTATSIAVNSARSLNPWNVNNSIKMLRDRGYGNQTVISAMRRIAEQKNKPAMAAAYARFSELARSAKEGWSSGSAAAKDANNAELQLLVGALKVMQGNPELGTLITSAELGESLAYLIYVNGRVSDLSQATDEKLLRLGTLSQNLKARVDAMNTSRRQWRQMLGITSGEPNCQS